METLEYSENYWKQACPKVDCKNKDKCCCGLKYVTIPASLGDDGDKSPVAPKNGAYCNSIVFYEANHHIYIYSAEGIPTIVDVDAIDVAELEEELREALIRILEIEDSVLNCFDTVEDMKASTALTNGSFAKTLGYYAFNGGGGAYYKIRNQRESDNVDEKFLISINESLVAELITGKQVDILKIGGSTDFVNSCNYLIQNGYSVYVPQGEYIANGQITFDKNYTRFDCDGDIRCEGQFTLFLITSKKNTINLNGKTIGYSVDGSRKDILMQIGGSESASYNNIFVEEALDFRIGFYAAPDNGTGVAYNSVKFTHVQASIGIRYKGGETGANYINENVFVGGRLEPYTYGISFEKGGPDQWDPYNGNKFYHIAIEPSRQCAIKIDFGTHNFFEQMRLSEGLIGDHYIEIGEGCFYNTFQNGSQVKTDQFQDENTDPKNYNHFLFSGIRDDSWNRLARECYTVGGTTFVPDGAVMNIDKYVGYGYNSDTFNLYGGLTCNGMTMRIGNDNDHVDMEYVLPNSFGKFGVTEFVLMVVYKGPNSTITIKWPDGSTAIENSDIDYQHGYDRFLCSYVAGSANYSDGEWLVRPMQ